MTTGSLICGRRILLLQWLAVLAIGLACFGCGKNEPLGQIDGKVAFQGRPVSEGSIVFTNAHRGLYMTARLGSDGSYQVRSANGPGLPLETYQVCISPPVPKVVTGVNDDAIDIPQYPNIPPRYRDPKSSGLVLTVRPGGNRFDVDMQP